MNDRQYRWFDLTDEEVDRLNPPEMHYIYDHITDEVIINEPDDKWLSVGFIPVPQTRIGWIVYHLIHGLAMRYPIHKVIGFAVCDRGYREETWLN